MGRSAKTPRRRAEKTEPRSNRARTGAQSSWGQRVGFAVLIICVALAVKRYSTETPAPPVSTKPLDPARSSSSSAARGKWPRHIWTEKTQPNVEQVLRRAANLTSVQGRPIKVQVLHKDPPILMIDNFLTEDQCELMIRLAIEQGLQRSTTTGEMKDGQFHRPIDDSRTSSNSWCFNECFRDPIVNQVDEMVEEFSARNKKNMEHYQLLHYEEGQQYKEHHDFIYEQSQMPQGPRQFTFFLYLNDVEAGGETFFPRLGLKIKPKKGRAVMWPNTKFNDDTSAHPKTFHAALPVLKGEKYGANKWIHRGDFLTAWESGVSG